MAERRGEKLGWTLGWLGSFCWVVGFGIWSFLNGNTYGGVTSLALFGIAAYLTWRVAPWHHAATPYWKLMIPLCGLFLVSIYLALRTLGGMERAGLRWSSFFWLGILALPLYTVGKRRWKDGERD
jgi:hypothetical protein